MLQLTKLFDQLKGLVYSLISIDINNTLKTNHILFGKISSVELRSFKEVSHVSTSFGIWSAWKSVVIVIVLYKSFEYIREYNYIAIRL